MKRTRCLDLHRDPNHAPDVQQTTSAALRKYSALMHEVVRDVPRGRQKLEVESLNSFISSNCC